MKCTNVEVEASAHIVDMFVKGESLIEHHSETLDVFREVDWFPGDDYEMR